MADGTIDVIATDHAPHAAFEKEREFELAPFGITGLETSFGLVNTYLVKPGYIDHARLAELMAIRPRDILRIPQVTLEVGSPADITVVDPDFYNGFTRKCAMRSLYVRNSSTKRHGAR